MMKPAGFIRSFLHLNFEADGYVFDIDAIGSLLSEAQFLNHERCRDERFIVPADGGLLGNALCFQ